MRNTNNQIMFDCFTSSHSVYFIEAVDLDFRKQYKGVIVNAHNDSGYGHFAIRKPITFWFKLPKFIQKLFPYKWVLFKNEKTKMLQLVFSDYEKSVEVFTDVKIPYDKLTFDKETYEDLKACIPPFLDHVGYKFQVLESGNSMTLKFE